MAADRPDLVGARVARVEDDRFLHARARYLDDLAVAGMLHLRLVRSPVAHARLGPVRAGAFEPLPRGARVVTGADAPFEVRADIAVAGARSAPQPVLARGVVRFAGEPVAAVLHPDPYVCEDAAEAVDVDYEPLDAVTDLRAALAEGAPRVHDSWPDNVHVRRRRTYGDPGAARAGADLSVRRVFRTRRQAGVPLEGRGCLAVPDGRGGARLWSSTQIPHLVRTYVAAQLGLAEHRLQVTAPDVGGGFGVKGHVFGEEVLCTQLALDTGRPVKWVEDRQEHLLASIHARDHLHLVEAAVTRDGRVLALKAQLVVDAGAYSVYPWTSGSDSGMAAKVLLGPYAIEHYEVEDIAVATNKCPLGTYRGVGRPSAVFTMERLMDEIAREVGLDPLAVRRANVVRDFPYRSAVGITYDPGSYAESLDLVEEALRSAEADAGRGREAGRLVGVGVALYNEQTAHGTPDFELRHVPIETGYESVAVSIDPQGRVTVDTGVQSHGQSLETTLAQVAAGELGVPLADVTVRHGDTATSPYTVGTWGSRGAVLGGGATAKAAGVLRDKLLAIAAHHLEADAGDLLLASGRVAVRGEPSSGVALADLAYWANRRTSKLPAGMDPGLHAVAFLDGPERGTFSNACHGAAVEVDPDTGKVTVTRYVVVEDCGVMINPTVVEGQIHGGVAQGIGSALLEEFAYSPEGQPLSATFMDYLLPSMTDVPGIDVHHLQTPSPDTPYGMKGMGEAGAIGPMAAIANAVSAALGRPVHETPMRMARVWDLLHGGEAATAWSFEDWSAEPALAPLWHPLDREA